MNRTPFSVSFLIGGHFGYPKCLQARQAVAVFSHGFYATTGFVDLL